MLWRACRGNVFLKQAEIETPLEDPVTGDQVNKSVFIIFFQGDQLRSRVKKICEGFRATLYPCPETQAERREMSLGVMTRIEDLNTVLSQTQDHRHRVLVAAAKNIKVWFIKVHKIKAIYHTLNMFNLDVTQKCLISECWCPVRDLEKIQMALRRGTERSGSSVPSILNRMETKQPPPTYNKTNKFTDVFQGIVDSYGVATYLEVNPAPFAIVSFPFLFSLMFGDAGHGLLMFLAALWMVLMEKKLMQTKSDNEIWNIFFGGRYIILLMGGFSMYAGLMYNDIFSKSFNIFGSAWFPAPDRYDEVLLEQHKDMTLDPTNNTDYFGSPYPFGMDPVWQLSENKISWLNSFKMKISVIFGVSQMFFGVILGLQNHKYFNNTTSIFCEFLPQMLFLMCIFGYLIILIFYKWIAIDATMAACAPSLLIDLINMFLYNYPTDPCSSTEFYNGQKSFQTFLLLLVAACIPWLLLAKPFVLRSAHKAKQQLASEDRRPVTAEDGEAGNQEQAKGHGEHGEEFDFGEIFVHQCIHTIEYCLGCISHTASYLRLWALSLAHAELSEVLWNMVLRQGFNFNGYAGLIAIFIVFAPWACLTIAILLLMEGLSAFLHTLRLHWVEFQSKFYKGEGYIFEPFLFDKIIEAHADETGPK
jgi:V-type H+-transporting ATPase subunit a